MIRVVSPTDMKAWDRSRIESGIPSKTLMLTAAEGLFDAAMRLRGNLPVTCICGSGNNGGDGIALAWLLKKADVPVRIALIGNPEKMTEDAAYYLSLAKNEKVPVIYEWESNKPELLVDAIFGVGLDRQVTGRYAALIDRINASGFPVLAADIPSGLDAQSGEILGVAIKAAETVTMQFVKTGLLLGQGRACAGTIRVQKLAEEQPFSFEREQFWQEAADVETLLPPRPFDSHKGRNGHALLCVGSDRYIGAALLSSRAALRSGCGILTAVVPDPVRSAFATLPEAITVPTGTSGWNEEACAVAISALENKNAVGIGCGIGSGNAVPLLEAVLCSGVRAVIDADGLNCLSKNRDLLNLLHKEIVITPHPGEMARLLSCSVSDVLQDPIAAATVFPCVTLLKGATTLVSDGRQLVYCTEGSPALAKGGSGDVLTGLITGLLAQGLLPFDAARAGTYLLGCSAKEAFRLLGERMVLASDVIDAIQ